MTGFLRRIWVVVFACACAASAFASDIKVVAKEPGYYTSLARHVVRWLGQNGIAADLVAGTSLAPSLAQAKMAFLLGYSETTAAEMKVFRSLRARGGRLVVFHSASPQLSELMGVKPLGYATAPYPGRWSRMVFDAKRPDGAPAAILQTSSVLQRAAPVKGRGRVLAHWCDRTGRPTGDAAWIATDGGYWMTHVFSADGDEHLKAQFLSSLVGEVAPRLWNARAFREKAVAEHRALSAFARRQQPRKGEIRAVWDHSGCGLYPGDWARTFRVLADARVTDLFVNVAGAGFAHYASDVLPRSKTFAAEGDQLAACLAAARGTGVRVHAWVLCFTGTRGTPERQEIFRSRGWRLKARDGRLTEYLDPSNPAVRAYLLKAVSEIQSRYRVDGIHLDFVRWYEGAAKPAGAAETISRFVAEARRRVKRPAWLTTAVLGKYPDCVASVGQDWTGWIDAGIVDYVVPMDYCENMARFDGYLAQHAAKKAHARKTIVGIGVTANESRLDARQVIEQIVRVRRRGLAGVALFDLDVTLEKRIFPYLKLGIW